MANHAYVKTKRWMSPEKITELIEKLNKERFKGVIEIDYHERTNEKPGWGPHTWLLTVKQDGQEYGTRVCWLNTKRSFEMRHGGGGDFMWWIDCSICNEVALEFDGNWTDDGCDAKEKGKSDYHTTFPSFIQVMYPVLWEKGLLARLWVIQMAEEMAPPLFKRKWRHRIQSARKGDDLELMAVKQ